MALGLVKSGEKQKASPCSITGEALLDWIDLQVCQLLRYILIDSAMILKIFRNRSSSVSSRVERKP